MHVNEIPNTNYLVSVHQSDSKFTNMEIFDISKQGRMKRIYTFGKVFGGKVFKF